MKRVLAISLALLASCALIFGATLIKPAAPTSDGQYKLGMGTVVSLSADETKATVTTVAVLTDGIGEIVDCVIDCGDFGISFDDVKAKNSQSYLTKGELGDDYGMVAYAGAKAEWYEQAEYFANYVKGMNAKDATYLEMAADTKPADADLLAGCTIAVGDFKKALVKAMGDTLAVTFKSDEVPAISLAMTNSDSISDYDSEADSYGVSMNTEICAVATFDGKVLGAVMDVAQSDLAYNGEGAVSSSFGGTKREKLDSYGMVAYAGAMSEWYEQADHFCDYIKGMTADEISAIEMGEGGKAADADLLAGCTVAVGSFVQIASKAMGK